MIKFVYVSDCVYVCVVSEASSWNSAEEGLRVYSQSRGLGKKLAIHMQLCVCALVAKCGNILQHINCAFVGECIVYQPAWT